MPEVGIAWSALWKTSSVAWRASYFLTAILTGQEYDLVTVGRFPTRRRTMTSKKLYAALLGVSLVLPMGVMMAQEAAPAQSTAAPASDAMTKDQAKAQKKQQKAQEKAAKDNANAAKQQEKLVKQQDKTTNAAEKARASQTATTTPQQ